MLFMVEMTVQIPSDLEAAVAERLKAEEKARALELQRKGVWRHLWRVVGRYANVSIFDVPSNEELHAILSELPLFPHLVIRVTPLTAHPSALHEGTLSAP